MLAPPQPALAGRQLSTQRAPGLAHTPPKQSALVCVRVFVWRARWLLWGWRLFLRTLSHTHATVRAPGRLLKTWLEAHNSLFNLLCNVNAGSHCHRLKPRDDLMQ